MKLYKQEITFNVVEMIGSMLEVSALQNERRSSRIKGGLSEWCELCVTSFSFGRQSGHTKGAIDYLYLNKDTYLVVHNQAMRQHLTSQHVGVAEQIIPYCYSLDGYNTLFRGKKGINVIIDSCSPEQYQRFMSNISIHIPHVRAVCRIGN